MNEYRMITFNAITFKYIKNFIYIINLFNTKLMYILIIFLA